MLLLRCDAFRPLDPISGPFLFPFFVCQLNKCSLCVRLHLLFVLSQAEHFHLNVLLSENNSFLCFAFENSFL